MGESIVDKDKKKYDMVHLHRIKVPSFRVLKNIDITFEEDLLPRIFPLGSLNGGGKSTLLQLIFTLLYSCGETANTSFIQNMLNGLPTNQSVAEIECIVNGDFIKLEFITQVVTPFKDYAAENRRLMRDREKAKRMGAGTGNLFPPMKNPKSINEKDCSFYICEYTDSNKEQGSLRCKFEDSGISSVLEALNLISKSVFLAAPITQSFRFIDQGIRELAFRTRAIGDYHQNIEDVRNELTSFFAYDAVAVDILIKAFTKARDDDFRFAIKNGNYGNSYQEMLKDIEEMLGDKIVNIDQDFEGVAFFKKNTDGKVLRLYPEDLSHGELKRLSLFIWLKYNKIENSIVLMDEIEIALHPDWQYQIVRDLETWAPSNQYILATHSYELCHALTPAHVKEISPRLLNK
jgi:predicted ATPase